MFLIRFTFFTNTNSPHN
jgi:ankyrin repeat protein